MSAGHELLGGLTAQAFLDSYWQRRPLLVRAAMPDFRSPLQPDELAGLACEDDVEARLILERGGRVPWEVRHGPFTEADFAALPASHWTLLVQDVEKHLPALAPLLDAFSFVPRWRIDDLMISYAAPEGSVGPHLDQYDVFLLQAHGRRRWQVQFPPPSSEALLAGVELRILREFNPSEEWILEPGDMLYLPPGVPHHGVALEPCMTYSIGFRAPSRTELLGELVDYLHERGADPRYADPGLTATDRPGELSPAVAEALRNFLRGALELPPDEWAGLLGRALTQPKPLFEAKTSSQTPTGDELATRLAAGDSLLANPASRLLLVYASDVCTLFADGEAHPLDAQATALLRELLNMGRPIRTAAAPRTLLTLLSAGHLLWSSDVD